MIRLNFWYKVLIVVAIYIVLVFVFSAVYHAYEDWHIVHDTPRHNLEYSEAFWLSVSTQTLLGQGDMNPMSMPARIWMCAQAASTYALVILIAATGLEVVYPGVEKT